MNIRESEILEAKIGGQPLDEKDFIQRYGWFKPSSPSKNIPPLTNKSNNFSNTEVHRFSQFSPYKPNKEKIAHQYYCHCWRKNEGVFIL